MVNPNLYNMFELLIALKAMCDVNSSTNSYYVETIIVVVYDVRT